MAVKWNQPGPGSTWSAPAPKPLPFLFLFFSVSLLFFFFHFFTCHSSTKRRIDAACGAARGSWGRSGILGGGELAAALWRIRSPSYEYGVIHMILAVSKIQHVSKHVDRKIQLLFSLIININTRKYAAILSSPFSRRRSPHRRCPPHSMPPPCPHRYSNASLQRIAASGCRSSPR